MKQISIIGTLMHNAEWRNGKDGNRFLTFDVSVYNGKNSDGTYKASDFFNCTLNEKYAEKLSQYLLKKIKVYVNGIPNVRAYIAKDGSAKANMGINVNNIELLGNIENTKKEDYSDNYNLSTANKIHSDDLNTIPF